MSLTRDDVLRELELLPAWKLRVPIETKAIDKVEVVAVEKPSSTLSTQYEISISQDKHWAFISEISMPVGRMDASLQSTLLNNILHALSIEKPSKMQTGNLADVQAKIIVAMGESVAQALLNRQDALENLRGKLHVSGKAQLIATHDLAHLLKYPADKAKVWQDLCLARAHLQSLRL